MINVVGYCRFSSNNQREESIDAQKRAIKYFSKQEGYHILRFYEDKAISGKSANHRPAFLQMIEDSKSKEFQAVVVHKLDRFSRDLVDNMTYEKELKHNGVELISVMERLDSSPTGKLMKIIIAGINSFYVDNLAIEVFKGLKENAYNCLATGGTAPLGYDIIDKKYVVNEKEAESVRIIFEMYADGYDYIPIMRKLNELGYLTKSGKPFGKNSLFELLRNERYKGVFTYNKHTARNHDGTRTRTTKPDEEIIRIKGGLPAIVSEELWDRCHVRIMSNKGRGGSFKAKELYLLSGLIYCGECGYAMHGNGRYPAPDRSKLITYRCSHKDNTLGCSNKEIKRDDVENFVIDQLDQYLFCEEIIPALTQQLNEYTQTTDSLNDIPKYEKRLEELQRNKSNLIDAIGKTGLSDVFAEKIADIESEITATTELLHRLQNHGQLITITEEMVRVYLQSFKEFVQERNKPQIKRFIDSFVERVDVYRDEVKVTFKVVLPTSAEGNVEYQFKTDIQRKLLKKKLA